MKSHQLAKGLVAIGQDGLCHWFVHISASNRETAEDHNLFLKDEFIFCFEDLPLPSCLQLIFNFIPSKKPFT